MSSFISVGIDIGTTSTHLTVSRLTLANANPQNQAPRLVLSDREIIHLSDIHFTPLTEDGIIDADKVLLLIESEYERAGINPANVQAGAAIITGETARKRNADFVIQSISGFAGELVAASAGPHLEGILAARGSGAVEYSREYGKSVLNIDFGGGTVNCALYRSGNLIDSSCLTIGGRCLVFDLDGRVNRITESALSYFLRYGFKIAVGDELSSAWRSDLASILSLDLINFLCGRTSEPLKEIMSIEGGFDYEDIDLCFITGGVAEFIKDDSLSPDSYFDMGGYFGRSLKDALLRENIPHLVPDNPIRATVIGAGMFSLQVSGATVEVDSEFLPVKNVPILRPFPEIENVATDQFLSRLKKYLIINELNWKTAPAAIEIPELGSFDYGTLRALCSNLCEAYRVHGGAKPFIIVCEQDLAMAIGMLVRNEINDCPLIVIDGISTQDGDFIDIGRPFREQGNEATVTLPVVVKTLVF